MSTQRDERIPRLTLGWRMKMALGDEVSVQEMADYLDVSRQTCGRWMADKGTPPRGGYLKLWALRTGVPLAWLQYGIESHDPGDGDNTLVRSYRIAA